MLNQAKTLKKNSAIGIIGGGQLGRMTCFAAHAMGFRTVVFTDSSNSSATFVSNQVIVADYQDKEALKKFASMVDVATFEFENIPFSTIDFLHQYVDVCPNSQVLKITQNRLLEKDFLNAIGAKTTEYSEVKTLQDLQKGIKDFSAAILKTAAMGYDGKGQFVIKSENDIAKIWPEAEKTLATNQLILEKFCPFNSEISVIIARSIFEEIAVYEPLTNIHKNGILDESHFPAKVSEAVKNKAQELAKKIAVEINLVGVLAVEMFVIEDQILVNELAPRPHNSGHFSMDASVTSQFEQLIRAISGLPLGSTKFHSTGHMKNLIGDEVNDLENFYKNQNAKIHLYGKDEVKKDRKMGHINIINY
ncbi:MAG: 5-(carboxyamino)imidazole ribonucleotide synthase [Pelagibacterales bacterium]|nr:5-(carboxyamino)imidazole ribonucleotide synthase [Pelagibacterales bacterium]